MSPCLINIQQRFRVICYPEGKGNVDHREREIKIRKVLHSPTDALIYYS